MAPSSSPPAVERLRALGDRAATLARERWDAAGAPSPPAKLWQIAAAMELVQRSADQASGADLDAAVRDVEAVISHLERFVARDADDRELELAHLTAQRALVVMSRVPGGDAERLGSGPDGPESDRVGGPHPALLAAYGLDARARRREAGGLAALGLVACGAAVWIAIDAASSPANAAGRASPWLPPLLASLMAFVVGVALLHSSHRQRLASLEATRLQRQLAAFEDLLEPLPPALRALTRASILRQFFPRLREDSEPWTETGWPDSAAVLEAMQLDRIPTTQGCAEDARA